ncbi:pentapeptide repeat-containing protein [Kitasatospora sp. NPDC093806]|uniref:pentapeptide repeat-containing protein n=1 Tax=Kitasatospora sp. NPDC093806 TaxID=3155075 RepID=UPI003447CB92
MAGLGPGSSVDHRGTIISDGDARAIVERLIDPETDRPTAADLRFDEATFTGAVPFRALRVTGVASFDRTVFEHEVDLASATFDGGASFWGARFKSLLHLDNAEFVQQAMFLEAVFGSSVTAYRATFRQAQFHRAEFAGLAGFALARFEGEAHFSQAQFGGEARFSQATGEGLMDFTAASFAGDLDVAGMTCTNLGLSRTVFEKRVHLGVPMCTGTLNLTDARFKEGVVVRAVAAVVDAQRARFDSTTTFQLRYAQVRLANAILEKPTSIAFQRVTWGHDESALASLDPAASERPKIDSLGGVDTAHLQLTDIDLTSCRFFGAVHLDKLSLAGDCLFDLEVGWGWRLLGTRRILPYRTGRRRILQEERDCRARNGRWSSWSDSVLSPSAGAAGVQGGIALVAGARPSDLVALYRQLRKGYEDAKDEPGAGDFYYGEMEMRRHSDRFGWWERRLLGLYWAVSGYGLRALRALMWLMVAMSTTVVALMLWGLPNGPAKAETVGAVPLPGQSLSLTTTTPLPKLTLPYRERITAARFWKTVPMTLNSVVFRSSGQNLTPRGNAIEMTSRLVEPALLALFVLALRSRVKR